MNFNSLFLFLSCSKKDLLFFILDEPDSHLHQTSINKITDIIKESLVDGFGFQVFLTTHNDKTVAYLYDTPSFMDREVATSGTKTNCFIMEPSYKDGPVKISKYTESLGVKLLLDNFYITMIASRSMTVDAFRKTIINKSNCLGRDLGMEYLVKLHTAYRTKGCLRFLNKIFPKEEGLWEKEDVDVIAHSFKNLYIEENDIIDNHPLTKLLENNSKITIVWPTDIKNKSFDCLIFCKKKLQSYFCQITVRTDINQKNKETFNDKFKKYDTIIQKIEDLKYKVKYMLIHGKNDQADGPEKHPREEIKIIKYFIHKNIRDDKAFTESIKAELKAKGCLDFLKKICPNQFKDTKKKKGWKIEDVEVIEDKFIEDNSDARHSLTDLLENNSNVSIVWPTGVQNPLFDCLILFGKELAVFAITERSNTDERIKDFFDKIQRYNTVIKKMSDANYKVEYILIHGKKELENEKVKKINNGVIDCYSFYSLGQPEYFDDEAMRTIHEIKIKDKTHTTDIPAEVQPSTNGIKRGSDSMKSNRKKQKKQA